MMVTVWEHGVSRQVALEEMLDMHEDERAAAASRPQAATERLEADMAEMESIQAAMDRFRCTAAVASDISIEEMKVPGSEITAAMARLMPQLSEDRPPPTAEHLAAVIASPEVALFVARLRPSSTASISVPTIVGTISLVTFDVPSGRRAAIEDLVVDSSARGQGIGRLLLERALDAARSKGAVKVQLTSRPSRVAANALYRRAGFSLRETNCYSLQFDSLAL